MTDKRSETDRGFLCWGDSCQIENISLILGRFFFKFRCWTVHAYYVIMFSPKMLARNCKRCKVRFYLILVRYWMCIWGHTVTTSDQVSYWASIITVFSPLWRMFTVVSFLHAYICLRTFLPMQILPLHLNFLPCFFLSKIRLCSLAK